MDRLDSTARALLEECVDQEGKIHTSPIVGILQDYFEEKDEIRAVEALRWAVSEEKWPKVCRGYRKDEPFWWWLNTPTFPHAQCPCTNKQLDLSFQYLTCIEAWEWLLVEWGEWLQISLEQPRQARGPVLREDLQKNIEAHELNKRTGKTI